MRARDTEASGIYRLLTRYVSIEPDEVVAVLWSALYFFSLLCGYYILRPMREEMGIAGGIENLDWMFTGTFVAMLAAVPLFGWAAARYRRSRLLPAVYTFFIANIIGFYALFVSDITHAYVARAFFIWVSVFNLFVVSVFWSFMTDVYSNQQARRLFGFIAAGGTLGALAGPALTAALVGRLGTANLLLLSAAFLAIALLCISRVLRWVRLRPVSVEGDGDIGTDNTESDNALGGNIFAGIPLVIRSPYLLGICALILLYTTLATFLYFQQAEIVRDSFADPATRTSVFAGMDFATNLLTVLAQVFLTARIVRRFGIAVTLALIPVGLAAGFLILSFAPVLSVLVVLQVLRRAGNFSIMKPAREMLYVVLGREEKYKAKNFIDTVVYRGGDAVSAWAYSGLQALGLTLSAIAFLAVPLAALWAMISYRLGSENQAIVRRIADHSAKVNSSSGG